MQDLIYHENISITNKCILNLIILFKTKTIVLCHASIKLDNLDIKINKKDLGQILEQEKKKMFTIQGMVLFLSRFTGTVRPPLR